jgi:tRNA (cmo5U34)-methyltransferase
MQDKVIKHGKWEFDEDVTKVFDDMLQRSIPEYESMRDLIYRVGRNFVNKDSTLIDLGCSRGESFRRFAADGVKIIGCEVSKPMIEACRMTYEDFSNVAVVDMDIKKDFPKERADLTLSVLTLQFIPIEYRHDILRRIYENLNEHGAFILVEKVLGNSADVERILVDTYYSIKSDHRYTQEQIESKRKALEGVLVPITSKWNEEMLYNAGFKTVDGFWRCCNFCGWLALK